MSPYEKHVFLGIRRLTSDLKSFTKEIICNYAGKKTKECDSLKWHFDANFKILCFYLEFKTQ